MIRELLLDENLEWYTAKYELAEYKTVYHDPGFLYAEEAGEEYPAYLYCYEEGGEYVIFPSIKRRINDLPWFEGEDLPECFDIVTPHEYSGVVASNADEGLINNFYKELTAFCKENKIIYSFIRFNPYTEEHNRAFGYEIVDTGLHICVDVTREDFFNHFKSNCRRIIRHAQGEGLTFIEVEKSEKNLEDFLRIYARAMERLHAKKFFYFTREYFDRLILFQQTKLYTVQKDNTVYAMGILLLDSHNGRSYYHLGCRDENLDVSGAMDLLMYGFCNESRKKGFNEVHLGGGSAESLQTFKRKFSQKSTPYYVGYKIFDNDMYDKICKKYLDKFPDEKMSEFMPLYRSME